MRGEIRNKRGKGNCGWYIKFKKIFPGNYYVTYSETKRSKEAQCCLLASLYNYPAAAGTVICFAVLIHSPALLAFQHRPKTSGIPGIFYDQIEMTEHHELNISQILSFSIMLIPKIEQLIPYYAS